MVELYLIKFELQIGTRWEPAIEPDRNCDYRGFIASDPPLMGVKIRDNRPTSFKKAHLADVPFLPELRPRRELTIFFVAQKCPLTWWSHAVANFAATQNENEQAKLVRFHSFTEYKHEVASCSVGESSSDPLQPLHPSSPHLSAHSLLHHISYPILTQKNWQRTGKFSGVEIVQGRW
ncbi:hypothetical protein EVAR_28298_1 [Eumeta japonica]|uniref:Uncharacterized protein n=1 Tax=Eumeta variegata TaxID=151549 RepID=A0A4C1V982_EUMVA|nr:hypothetical protein EVAR_28298_1 [Eumeta japonica]